MNHRFALWVVSHLLLLMVAVNLYFDYGAISALAFSLLMTVLIDIRYNTTKP